MSNNEQLMDLTLENLNEIHAMLMSSYEEADIVLGSIDLNDTGLTPTPEKRVFLNLMMDKISGYLLEISHVDSFLQQCDVYEGVITPEQQKTILACQQLCQKLQDSSDKVLRWVVDMKARFNEAACPVPDVIESQDSTNTRSPEANPINFDVPTNILETYQQWRAIFKEIHKDLLYVDAENMINTAGKRLEVMKGKQMFIETEHEMNVLIDYGLFQYRKDGLNIAERYYNSHHNLYSGQKLAALDAFRKSRFSLLQIIKPVDEQGVLVHDPLIDESFLMIDQGVNHLAKNHKNYVLLTHYLQAPGFVMTTGASVPISLDSTAGKKMWIEFEQLIRHYQNEKILDVKSCLQCLTDLYKMVIHDDLVKTVSSRELPMAHHQLSDKKKH